MIFVTVGTQLPFPRLVATMDAIAGARGLHVVAQTCEPGARYTHMRASAVMVPADFDQYMREAEVIVGHAGIGTILGAGSLGKPLILFPRRASLGEHRNEHQLATVRSLGDREGIYVATDANELDALIGRSTLQEFRLGEGATRAGLIAFLHGYVHA